MILGTGRDRIENAINLAKEQLPGAFSVGSSLPLSIEAVDFEGMVGLELDNLLGMDETTLLGRNDNLGDLEEGNRELGFDALAFYISFHKPAADNLWGIFLLG